MPRSLRIVTWNVNSIRSRHERVVAWMERHQPDVLLLQETKCTDALFAQDEFTGEYERLGYEAAHHGHGGFNGVALLSRVGLSAVERDFPGQPRYGGVTEARAISATCGGVRIHSLYVPNGREVGSDHYAYKLDWFDALAAAVAEGPPDVALCGA